MFERKYGSIGVWGVVLGGKALHLVTEPPHHDAWMRTVVLDQRPELCHLGNVEIPRFVPHQHANGVQDRVDDVIVCTSRETKARSETDT